jgi:DNA-binding transcriptional ArsR family regulator
LPAAPADRYLEVLAEPTALQIVRALDGHDLTQGEIVREVGIPQSVVSRSLKVLRAAGLVASETPRGPLHLRAGAEVHQLLLHADRLAEALNAIDDAAQKPLSARTRRAGMRTASGQEEVGGA